MTHRIKHSKSFFFFVFLHSFNYRYAVFLSSMTYVIGLVLKIDPYHITDKCRFRLSTVLGSYSFVVFLQWQKIAPQVFGCKFGSFPIWKWQKNMMLFLYIIEYLRLKRYSESALRLFSLT